MTEPSKPVFRTTLAGLGGLGGLTLWALSDPLHDLDLAHSVVLGLWALAVSFFISAMTAMGPLPVRKAVTSGLVVAVPVAFLVGLASLRFETLDATLDSGHLIIVTLLLISLVLPFVICALRDGRWRDYTALFDTSWRLVVHFTAAWIFAGLCWAMLALSGVLLDLVGITIIEDLINEEVFAFIFTGLVLGLGLAVIFELSDYISPYLVLSLLRLLLIPLAVIVTIFLLALPFRGLSNLFDTLSPALVMMATAIGLISLISVAVERDDEDAIAGPIMQTATRISCGLLVVLTGLAVYAVVLRVVEYGWTPPRFAAFFIAAVTLAYGVTYAITVLRGPDWMARIRRANVWLALGVMAALALCMTPLIHPQKLSVNSQLARFERGAITADELPFRKLRYDWGKAGAAAFAALSDSDDPLVQTALAAADTDNTGASEDARRAASIALLGERVITRPEGMTFPEAAFTQLSPWQLDEIRRTCLQVDADLPERCLLVQADFLTAAEGLEYALLIGTQANRPLVYWLSETGLLLRQQPRIDVTGEALIAQILSDGFAVTPVDINALRVGDMTFNPFN
ncbi:DUF4153 domain-containing protein [Cognatishimia sp. MH4019]|uniref:DUF4153 domain-containing protein n=1 Tax=Cognatishimia sp. MH4019 TaxID=2854030 RepID=UPI001CD760F2|nr:DUF4153 domain-containing protein [Cognatishimia sp. MH4019]